MKEEVQKALARSEMYKIFSEGLDYPNERFRDEILDGSFLKRLRVVAGVLSKYELEDGIKALEHISSKLDRSTFLDLTSEHSCLFGVGKKARCPPYELEYFPGRLFLKTHKLADIAGFYSAFGLEISGKSKDRPDHASIELEFMSFLSLKEAYAVSKEDGENAEICRDAQRKFLQDHLGKWILVLCEQIDIDGGSQFYAVLGRLLNKFVSQDVLSWGINPEIIRFHPSGDENSSLVRSEGITGIEQMNIVKE